MARRSRAARKGRLPLEGVRILEISLAWAVPYAMKLLAVLGAEVIKVESHTRPDVNRVVPFPENRRGERWWDTSGMYHTANLSKLGATLNFSTPEGRELCLRLASLSDVVVENFAPRVLKNFGLDYERMRQVRPDIIMLSSSAFGHSGPFRDYVGYGWGLEPMTGLSQLTGYPDGPPLRSSIPHTDQVSALYADFAILAALEHRRRTGQGQWIDLSQYQAGVSILPQALLDYALNGRVQGRMANRHQWMAPHGVYRCRGADDWLAIAVGNDAEWEALCRVMGRPELDHDPRYADGPARWQQQDELDAIVEGWTRQQDHLEAMRALQAAGVPAGAVLNHKELLLDPHLRERGAFVKVGHTLPEVGVRWHMDAWFKLSGTPAQARGGAPTMGQHNPEVLGGLLGLSEGDLEELRRRNVIGEAPASPTLVGDMPPLELQRELGLIQGFDPDYRRILGYD